MAGLPDYCNQLKIPTTSQHVRPQIAPIEPWGLPLSSRWRCKKIWKNHKHSISNWRFPSNLGCHRFQFVCMKFVLSYCNPPAEPGHRNFLQNSLEPLPCFGAMAALDRKISQGCAAWRVWWSSKGAGWVLLSILVCWKRSFSTNEKKWNPGDESLEEGGT